MKKVVCIFLLFLIPFWGYSANVEKQFKKLIRNYDVADEAKMVKSNSTLKFWMTMLDNNESLLKFFKDIKKKRGAGKEAVEKTIQLPRFEQNEYV